MSRAATHIVSALILGLWMAPSAGALAVGLHLALDHHGPHGGAEHTLEISDFVQTAAHGHHHHDAETASDHDHDATAGSSPGLSKVTVSWLEVAPASASREAAPAERFFLDGAPRRGPPLPLFTSHCSLLL